MKANNNNSDDKDKWQEFWNLLKIYVFNQDPNQDVPPFLIGAIRIAQAEFSLTD